MAQNPMDPSNSGHMPSRHLQDPMKPDSKKILGEKELQDTLEYITFKIEGLKSEYPHLEKFDATTALSGSSRIWYQNNIRQKPNPDYEYEVAKRKSQPPVKRPLPEKTIPHYPEKDGIDLFISFTSYEEYTMNQRIWVPDLWIGNYAVELKVQGKRTLAIKSLHKKVFDILSGAKKRIEK